MRHIPYRRLSFGLVLLAVIIAITWQPRQMVQSKFSLQDTHPIIYFFWGDGCPHCAEAEPFLEGLQQKYPQLEVRAFEVWYNEDNQNKLQQMAANFNFKPRAVPTIFLGEQYWTGWNDILGSQIEEAVKACLLNGCPDAGSVKLAQNPSPSATPPAPVPTESSSSSQVIPTLSTEPPGDYMDVPLIGRIDLSKQSLFLSTLLISLVDGVNPCSVWVLTMLLALVVHTGSRKKILIIGLVFLTITAGVYAIFIAGLFTIFTVVNYLKWIQLGVSLIALVLAVINIKDYFWYKEGVSLTISDKEKPGLFQKMRNVLAASSGSFWGLITATAALGFGVSMVEFSCTAGFPVLWTNMLTANQVGKLEFSLLLVVYMFIYQLDELVIFLAAVFTLKATRMQEKYGRILKLLGGVLMLTLAVVMIINPALMNTLANSLIIFGAAFVGAILILLLHRRILPHFGIRIGTEAATGKAGKIRRKRH